MGDITRNVQTWENSCGKKVTLHFNASDQDNTGNHALNTSISPNDNSTTQNKAPTKEIRKRQTNASRSSYKWKTFFRRTLLIFGVIVISYGCYRSYTKNLFIWKLVKVW